MSSHIYRENFVSIRQAVAEKNTKVMCSQTNGPFSFGEGNEDRRSRTSKGAQTQEIDCAELRIGIS